MKNIWFVMPAYNEEDAIEESAKKLLKQRQTLIESGKLSCESKILFVDDGSKDNTWTLIEELHNQNDAIKGLKLVKNSGQQNALFAGYEYVSDKCDAVISLDADLQDDISILEDIIDKYVQKGYEMVVVTHNNRQKDTLAKVFFANTFYNLMNCLDVNLIKNHSEYRLLDKVLINRLMQYKEDNLFLRGLILKLTNNYYIIETERELRKLGTPKYNFFSSLDLAMNGITSLTSKPIKLILLTGVIVMVLSVFADTPELSSIWLLGGLQILFIGLIGEYIAKINLQTKNRPKYFIEKDI